MGRRQLDWIQFGILLVAVLTLLLGTAVEHGKILQELADEKATMQDLQARMSRLEEKWDRFQATQPQYQPMR